MLTENPNHLPLAFPYAATAKQFSGKSCFLRAMDHDGNLRPHDT